ncbi:hypothetical protein NUU61_008511 [Penicillium alfredii]|uniref:Uncharacterized protein n=1 Tax=Penicillium alfredii TaxID=1506179 RepID=A0A9W9ELC5_9EURO|nr:uncharacterized protein NUU61_008511 [Penicillium alfredii]KAJ5083932.1 hypothetical protein NUU61_008511 [Penicillium alfredii]
MHTHQTGYFPQRSLSQTSASSTSSRGSQRTQVKMHTRKSSNPISSKLFRGRSKSPMPIDIPMSSHSRQSSGASQPHDVPRSAPETSFLDQHLRSTSPVQMSPDNASPRSPKPDFGSKGSSLTRKNSDDYRRLNGTINHCGRHANDWLFGGFSVRETVRDGIEKLRNHDKEG